MSSLAARWANDSEPDRGGCPGLDMPDKATSAVQKSNREVLADYLVTFAPWVGYFVLDEVTTSWRLGFTVGLGLSAIVVAWRTFRRDSRFMDIGTLCYCTVMAVIALTFPHSPLQKFDLPLSLVAVGMLSLLSLLMPPPFTYRIHRDKMPGPLLADAGLHRLLIEVHRFATSSWAVAQTLAGVLAAALIVGELRAGAVAMQVIGTIVPVAITRNRHHRFLTAASRSTRAPAAAAGEDTVVTGDQEAERGSGLQPAVLIAREFQR